MFWNSLDNFDGSDLVSWLDEATRQRITTFFQEIRATELGAPFRREQDYRKKYLDTPLWAKIRRRVLKRDKSACRCCGGRATQVHHRSYAPEVMRGENDDELACLCEGCHNYIHFDESGTARTAQESDRLLLAGRSDTHCPTPKVDLRRKSPQFPREWNRMSAIQRSHWYVQYHRIRGSRWDADRGAVASVICKGDQEGPG